MNFFDAMAALQLGATVKSACGDELKLNEDDEIVDAISADDNFEITDYEINAEWSVVEPKRDFAWALETLLEGDLVRRASWPKVVHFNIADDGRLLYNAQPQRPLSPEMLQEWITATDWVRA